MTRESEAGPAAPAKRRAPALLDRPARSLTPGRALALLLLLGIAWRVLRYALAFPYWGDESFVGVNFLLRDFRGMVDPLWYGQIVPLFFMWAELAISRVLGVHEVGLRLLPCIAGVAAVLVFWRFCAGVLPRRAVVPAVGFLASSYYAVRHGAELKPYATDLFVSLVLTCSAWSVLTHPRSVGRWALLVAIAAIAPWASYPAVFVCGGIGLVLAWQLLRPNARERLIKPELAGLAAYGLVLGASFAAMYLIYARPHAQAAAGLTEISMWTQAFPPVERPWLLPIWLLVIHSGLMLAYPVGGTTPGSVATLLFVVIGVIALWRRNRALTLLLLSPLPLNLVAAALKAYPYGGTVRTSIFLAPAFCLFGGYGLYVLLRWLYLDGLRRLRSARGDRRGVYLRTLELLQPLLRYRFGALLVVLALAAIPIAGMIGDAREPYTSDAVLRSYKAVRELAGRTQPGDRWMTFNAAWGRVDYAPWLGDWHGTGGQFVFDALRFAPAPIEWAPPAGAARGEPGRRVYLLAYRGFKVIFPEQQLAAYLGELRGRWGEPRFERFFIKEKKDPPELEALDVYTFQIPPQRP